MLEVRTREPLPPVSHLVAYYVTQDGETVADTLRIDAQPCLNNQVPQTCI